MSSEKSLQGRLLLGVLLSTCFIWIGLCASGYAEARRQLDELMDAHLEQAGTLLAAQLTEDDARGEIELEHVRQLHRYGRNLAFQVWDHEDRLRLKSASAPAARMSDTAQGFSTQQVAGQPWRVYSARIGVQRAQVQIGEPVSARERVGLEITAHLLAPMFIALPLLGLTLAFAIRRALKPLAGLAARVSAMKPDQLEPLPTDTAPSEVHPLVEQLNQLFARIRQSLEKERRFTADAAHELRTPIAAIAAHAQIAENSTHGPERRHALEQVLVGCDRSTHLIDQLMTMARMDSTLDAGSGTRFDLVASARSVLAELGAFALTRNVHLEFKAPAQLAWQGHEAWYCILLRNLVDNAIRYGRTGGRVLVELRNESEGAVLEVRDDGPGIPATERDRALERFYRVAGSDEVGTGLGLSIVSRITQLCQARLTLSEGRNGQGLSACIAFPSAPGAAND